MFWKWKHLWIFSLLSCLVVSISQNYWQWFCHYHCLGQNCDIIFGFSFCFTHNCLELWSLLTIFPTMTQVWVTITSHLDMQAFFLSCYFSSSSVMVYFPHSNHIIPFKRTSGQSMSLNNGPPIIPLLGGSLANNLPVKRRDNSWEYHCWVGKIPGEGNGNCSSILAWKILWKEEPGGLQSIRSQRIRLDWATEHACTLLHSIFR